MKRLLKILLPYRFIQFLRKFKQQLLIKSIQSAVRSQNREDLYKKLETIVPDIRFQYSNLILDSSYLLTNVRALHSFQITLVEKALILLKDELGSLVTVVDIGDSTGTHLQYLQGLHQNIHGMSVNCDLNAVTKIRQKGIEAICAKAENLDYHEINADLFLSFELLEHLNDPINFLKKLADSSKCKAFIITVPYLAKSRVGLHHIRKMQQKEITAETSHIYEFSPSDWGLIFQHSGWKVISDDIYYQYPRYGILRLTQKWWRKDDFEGFYGVILKRDSTWSSCYRDW